MSVHAFANLRDVAHGLPPATLREGVLLRSDAPLDGYPVPDGVAWPPRTVVDLRHPVEWSPPHPFAESATVHAISLVDPRAPGPTGPDTGDGLATFYSNLLAVNAVAGLVRIVGIVAESNGPVLIHCLAGKDRTGVAVAFLLRLVGVDREEVIQEYLRTNLIAPALVERLAMHYAAMGRQRGEPITLASVEAPRALIADMIDRWDEHPGGTRGWFLERGGEPHTVDQVRARFLPF
jgi:protein-tyrosine phosphatase